MSAGGVLPLALLVLAVLLAVLAAAVASRRGLRLRAERRRAETAEPLRPLLMQLAAGEPQEAAEALERLVALDARLWRAVEPNVEALLGKVRGETRAAVVGLLERRGTLARALASTRSRSGVARAHGAEVLGAAGRKSAVPDLVQLLTDPDPEVRQVAARSLGRIGAATAAAPLLAALGPPHELPPRVVATAVLRLGVGAHDAVRSALRSGDPLQRSIAAEVAGLSGAVSSTDVLVDLLRADPELEVRLRCARALGRIGSPVASEVLVSVVEDDEPLALRVVAARALGDLGDVRAVPRLAQLVTHPAHRLAANAATALTRCGQPGLRALSRLVTRPEGAHARDALATAALRGLNPQPEQPPRGRHALDGPPDQPSGAAVRDARAGASSVAAGPAAPAATAQSRAEHR